MKRERQTVNAIRLGAHALRLIDTTNIDGKDTRLENDDEIRVWWPNMAMPERGKRFSVLVNERRFSGRRDYQIGLAE